MIIRRIEFKNFGCLSGEFVFSEGLTVILGDNEAGKTTLADGITAMLYGPEGSGDYNKYNPWKEGREFGGTLELGLDGDSGIFIARKFLPKNDCKILTLPRREDITSKCLFKNTRPYRYSPMEFLYGITSSNFISSSFVPQGQAASADLPGLSSRVESLIASGDESGATPAEAVNRLRNALKGYRGLTSGNPISADNEIKWLREGRGAFKGINDLEAEKDALYRERDRLLPDSERLKNIEKEVNFLDRKKSAVERLSRAAAARAVQEELKKDDELREKAAALEEKIESGKRYESFPVEKHPDLIRAEEDIRKTSDAIRQDGDSLEKLNEEIRKNIDEQQRFNDLTSFTKSQEESLKNNLVLLEEWENQAAGKSALLEETKKSLAESGVPLDFTERLSTLSPGERSLIDGAERDGASLSKEKDALLQQKEEILDLENKYRENPLKKISLALLIFGVIIIFGGIFLKNLFWLFITGGGILLACGIAIFLRYTLSSSGELALIRVKKEALEKKNAEIKKQASSLNSRLEGVSAKLGISGSDELFKIIKGARSGIDKLRAIDDEIAILKSKEQKTAGDIRGELTASGFEPPQELSRAYLEKLLERLKQALSLREAGDALRKEEIKLSDDLKKSKEALEPARKKAQEILESAGISEPFPDGLRTFEKELDAASKYRDLKKRLEMMRSSLMPADSRARLEQRLKNIGAVPGGTESAASESGVPPGMTPEDYQKISGEIDRKTHSLREEKSRILQEITTNLKALDRLSDIEDEAENKKLRLRKTEDFKAAVELAAATLEKISENLMPGWAGALNKHVEAILPKFAPTISGVEFDRGMQFSFHIGGDMRLVSTAVSEDLPLSRGTLDQLYLGIRLALCRLLSGDVRLPVILDEPFAHADESRFVSGMNALAELSETYGQIIVLSCHRMRYDNWIREYHSPITILDLNRITAF
ncbi:MAG: AAA family ATPase [Chloroflexi bacterium]|nr:AAA family ATPase [Chloroflexota bacterium]